MFFIFICGGDEAGRGAVIGPLIVAIVATKKESEKKFSEIGVRDSKMLTRERREELYDKIKKASLASFVDSIQPEEINNAMKNGISLNELEAVHFAKLFDKLDKYISILYLDSPDVIEQKFGMRINIYSSKPTRVAGIKSERQKGIKYTKIISEHKADSRYPVVSAASIIAKVTRDYEIDKLSNELGIDLGSGYPSDQKTIEAIKANLKNENLMKHIRDRWITIEGIRQTRITNF
ncbi:MAG: ribonuclease HII [Candidatus Micrarchaeia archaeon]